VPRRVLIAAESKSEIRQMAFPLFHAHVRISSIQLEACCDHLVAKHGFQNIESESGAGGVTRFGLFFA
jgi:hypothetical protein